MPPVFPVPTLDHVVVNARDRIDDAAETYRRLGFTLTPRGYHTLGSMNHLAMFGTDYLELIAAKPGDDSRPEIMDAPFGLDGLVFGTEDAAATYEALRRNEVPIDPPQQFSRPVEIGGRDPRRGVPHHPPAAFGHAGRAVVFLPAPDPRPGLARRMAASRQRRGRRRPGGDRGRGPGDPRRPVRPHVRRDDGPRRPMTAAR